ncbi:hypothetical protein [Anditalea andensis]|uniref:hypothetical protein n=1 Tax=Anditalea andensis TaxID=1048983 RepID=UPI0013E085B1|nr:hypothetical protein [Anditalea andensis]
MKDEGKYRGIYQDEDSDDKLKKKPEKITDPLEDEAQQDDSSSRDLDTPQQPKKPNK